MISTNDKSKLLLHSVSASDQSSYQESGWSFYLEDFSDYFCGLTDEEGLLRSGFDKAVFIVDQELEDTASSPAPQNSDDELNQLYRNTEHMMDSRHMCQEYNFLNLPNQEEQEGIYYDHAIHKGKSNSSRQMRWSWERRKSNGQSWGEKGSAWFLHVVTYVSKLHIVYLVLGVSAYYLYKYGSRSCTCTK